uniref:Zinc finger, CCHC-type n=1 Tax=Tanacetum cinerariifolium TaxID=118510 RepID=A0A699GTZ0_TANCI|nr:zinc finger, CCHC-type [Tanacetum cinerariifolium]
MPELVEDATVKAIRIRAKWENDDYICRGHILNGMSDSLFDVYTNVESAKELWDSLESKYMAKDFSSKKFLDFKHTLKHGKDDLSLVQLGSHLRIEESLRVQKSHKGKGKEVVGPSVNMMEESGKNKNNKQNKERNLVSRITTLVLVSTKNLNWNVGSVAKLAILRGTAVVEIRRITQVLVVDAIIWWIDFGATTYVCKERCWFKTSELVKDGSVLYMGDDHFAPVHRKGSVGYRAVVRLLDPKRKTFGEKGIDCIFVGYAEHSKAYRFYVIEPNDSVSINTIIESRDAIFDENRFSSIPRPKEIIPILDESQRDDHLNDVPSETPESRKGKRVRKAKSYGSDFQLYLVEGSRGQIGSQYSYCYSIEEDPRTYNEAMQSRDSAFWKEAIDDEIGSLWKIIHGYCLIYHQLQTFRLQMDLQKEDESNEHKMCKLVKSLYGLKQAPKQWHQKFDEVVLSNGFLLNQSEKCVYSKFDGSGYSDASWINHVEDSSSTSVCLFLLGGGAISWASKKQTCINSSTIESEFVALAAAAKVLDLELLGSLVVVFGAIRGGGIGGGDPPPTCDNPQVVLINNLDAGNPIHVHNSDNSSSVLVPFKLLDRCNAMVLTWVMNVVSSDVYMGLVYSENIDSVWKDLNETYDKVDGYVVYNLLQKIRSVKQGGSTVVHYYHRLNSLRREFDAITKLPKCVCLVKCSCAASTELALHQELMKLMQFLIGLDDCYQPVRTALLTRDLTLIWFVRTMVLLVILLKGWIIDSGANPHLTTSTIGMINIVDISNINIIVGHPNGTIATISHVGDLRLSNNVILFDEDKCCIQDLDKGITLGIGSESGELYMFDDTKNKSLGNVNTCMAFNVSKNLWHNRLGHPPGQEENPDPNIVEPSGDHGPEEGQPNVRRSSRPSKMPAKFNDFMLDSKLKYGIEKHVNYSKLNTANYCFATTLNKSVEPTTYYDAVKDVRCVEAMNNEIEALIRNNTWTLTNLPIDRKNIDNK